MIQLPALSYPPEFIPLPFNWFQFAMLYIAGMELLLLALPKTWFVWIFRTAFPWNDHKRKRRMELSKPIPPISNDLPVSAARPYAMVGTRFSYFVVSTVEGAYYALHLTVVGASDP